MPWYVVVCLGVVGVGEGGGGSSVKNLDDLCVGGTGLSVHTL